MKLCLIFLSVAFLGAMAARLPRDSCHKKDRWRRLNSGPVCFGARGNQFGRFYIPPGGGNIGAIKLVYLYGYVSCAAQDYTRWSHWGCSGQEISIAITTSANHILLPASQLIPHAHLWSKIPGYDSQSPELVLTFFNHPRQMTSGQELRLWYGEDLASYTEGDNGGRVCCDVYGLFI